MREWYVMHKPVEDPSEVVVWNCRMANFDSEDEAVRYFEELRSA